MTQPISDLLLEQLLCGDLPAQEHQELAQRVAADPDATARLDAMREDNARLLNRFPPAIQAEQIKRRQAAATAKRRDRRLWIAAPLLAGLLAALLIPGAPTDPAAPDQPEVTRIKGLQPGLRIFRQAEGEPELLADGAHARAGDVLQIGWRAQIGQHVAVLSLDGRGQVTRHWPPNAAVTTPSEEASQIAPTAYKLDDAPELERFFLITSARPIQLPELERAIQALPDPRAELVLPSPQNQHDLIVLKER